MTESKIMILQYKKESASDWLDVPFVDKMVVGSGNVDLQLADGELSNNHFELRENPTGIFLKDLDSEAGVTFYDSNELETGVPVILALGQEFKAGGYVFRLVPGLSSPELPEPVEEVNNNLKITSQILNAASGVGKKRMIGIVVSIVLFSIAGALLIYFLWIYPPRQAEIASGTPTSVSSLATTENNSGTEAAAELTPTFGVDLTEAVEDLNSIIEGPGEGAVSVDSMQLGGNGLTLNQLYQLAMNPDQALSMAVDLYGENVAYAYIFSGLLQGDRVMATSMEYIAAEDTQVVDGVTAPDWGDDSQIQLDFEWKPFVYLLKDGENELVALLIPERYALTSEDIVYRVEGIYEPNGSNTRYDAYLRFDGSGNMLDLLTFGELGSDRGTPYKVEPGVGDVFIVYEQEFVVDPDSENELPINIANSVLSPELQLLLFATMKDQLGYGFGKGTFTLREGGRITFGEIPVTWSKNSDYEGDYVAGFAIQDLDNNFYVGYVPVMVNLP